MRQQSRPDFRDVPEARRRNMAAVRGKDTKPEIIIRRLLHAIGYRYRLHDVRLPGRPDLVFPSRKAVVEVRGCWWHRHGCSNSAAPKTRTEWWTQKLDRNVARDEANKSAMEAAGWRVFVAWECDIRRDPTGTIGPLMEFLGPPGRGRRNEDAWRIGETWYGADSKPERALGE
jgi:DNA mismatch endonuclease Vsr